MTVLMFAIIPHEQIQLEYDVIQVQKLIARHRRRYPGCEWQESF
jgi:hypothetical protein